MTTTIRIEYPTERMTANARRIAAAQARTAVDRAPVWVGAYDRYYLAQRGVSYAEYFADPQAYLHHKIMNQAWAIQNMPDDRCQAPGLTVYLDFENTANAHAFGAEIVWDDDGMPWTQPTLHELDDVERLEVPSPRAGLWGTLQDWYQAMCGELCNYRLLFNGSEAPITILPPDPGSEGPFTVAAQLAGTNLYLWLALYPEACRTFMQKITTGLIAGHRFARRAYPAPARTSFSVVNDGAELLSPAMFRSFCVPYDAQLYAALGSDMVDGRGKHMCGKIDHLLPILVQEERISSLWGFGDALAPETVAHWMGRRGWVRGNVSPLLLLKGTPAEVRVAARRVLAAFADCGGLILADGFNIAPATPLENIAALVQASEDWGPMGG